jgi:hypothetical protein
MRMKIIIFSDLRTQDVGLAVAACGFTRNKATQPLPIRSQDQVARNPGLVIMYPCPHDTL